MFVKTYQALLFVSFCWLLGCSGGNKKPSSSIQVCIDSSESFFKGIPSENSIWITATTDSCIQLKPDTEPNLSRINVMLSDTAGLRRILGSVVFDHIYGESRWSFQYPNQVIKIPLWATANATDTIIQTDVSKFKNDGLPILSIICDSVDLFGSEGIYSEGIGLPRIAGIVQVSEIDMSLKGDSLVGTGRIGNAVLMGQKIAGEKTEFRFHRETGFGVLSDAVNHFHIKAFKKSNSSYRFVIIDSKRLPNYRADNDIMTRVFNIDRSRLEKKCTIEFFSPDKKRDYRMSAGLGTSGNLSASFPQKGFNIYLRNDTIPNSVVRNSATGYAQRLRLRAGGSGSRFGRLNHVIANRMAHSIGLVAAKDRPVHVFLNGEYWGIYSLQEKLNAGHYRLSNNINYKVKEITYPHPMVSDLEVVDAERPDHLFRDKQKKYIQWTSEKLNDDDAIQLFETLYGEKFFDYIFHHTYLNNQDWLVNQNNILAISDSVIGKVTHYVIDQDDSFNYGKETLDALSDGQFSKLKLSRLFVQLMSNDSLKEKFVNRCLDNMANQYSYAATSTLVENAFRDYGLYLNSFNEERWGIYNPDSAELEKQKVATLTFLKTRGAVYTELIKKSYPEQVIPISD